MHCKQSAVFGHFGFNRYIRYFCHHKMKQNDIRVLLGKRKSDVEAKPMDDECEADLGKEPEEPPSDPKPKIDLKFVEDWLAKFKWLRHENDLLFCDTCKSAKATKNPFTQGCSSFQFTNLTRHQDSKVHTQSMQVLQMRSRFTSVRASAVVVRDDQSQGKLEQYAMQLRTVYTMVKRDIAASCFTDLMYLQTLNSINCDFYKRPQIVSEFEEIIEKTIDKSLLDKIDQSEYLGLMLDETCDISVHKKLAIYIRYLVNGEVFVAFVGNRQITDCTASGIETALIDFLVQKGIDDENCNKVYGLGTDGAAVMTGRLNGLGAKLKRHNPKLTQVHCVAHRLNLAASQAGKDIDYCKKFHEMIHALYRFYSDSSRRYDRLRELQELLNGKATQMTEPTSVRWLSVEAAIKTIYGCYCAVYQSLESEREAGKADGLLRFISTVKFLLFTALLIDVLTVVGILSVTFQKDSVNVSHIRHHVSSSKATLSTMKNGSQTVTEVLQDIGDPPAPGEKGKYKGLEVTDSQGLRDEFNHLRDNYIDKLLQF